MRAVGLRILKLKNYAESVSIAHNGYLERRILHFILMSFGALAVIYVLILGNMVFNIAERRTLDTRARALSSEVADLELSYLSLSNEIDLAYSHSLGFKEANAKFATRKALGSLNGKLKSTKNEI